MSWCTQAICAALLGQALGAQERAAAPAFVEVEVPAATVWLHEAIELLVRVGYDPGFFKTAAVPLFQQSLDQPFLVTLPWLFGAEDRAVEILGAAAGAGGQRVAVGDRVEVWQPAGERQVGDRTFHLLELRCRWLPLAAGVSTIAPVEVRYAFATRFEDGLLGGRQPLDRQEATVASAPRQLTVRALPIADRPEAFTGAVGEFEVRAALAVAAIAQGSAFALEVVVTGRGNLERFAPMPWPRLPGFQVQGLVEKRAAAMRTFVFDVLALRVGLTEVPPVRFVAFSPRTGSYVTLTTAPVPLQVTPRAAGTELPERVRQLVAADAEAVRAAPAVPWWAWLLAGVAVVATVRVWCRRVRGLRHRAALQSAFGRLEAALAVGPAEVLGALEALCGACAAVHPFVAEAVWNALASRGASPQLVARLRACHAEFEAARYGGPAPAPAAMLDAARDLVASCGFRTP